MLSRGVSGLTRTILRIARAQNRSNISVTLPYTAALVRVKTEPRQINPGHRNGDNVLALLSDQFALSDVLLQLALDFSTDDLPESAVVLFDLGDQLTGVPPSSHLPEQRCLPQNS